MDLSFFFLYFIISIIALYSVVLLVLCMRLNFHHARYWCVQFAPTWVRSLKTLIVYFVYIYIYMCVEIFNMFDIGVYTKNAFEIFGKFDVVHYLVRSI